MENKDISPLDEWQQGDLALTSLELPYIEFMDGNPEVNFIEAPFGVAVLTQTCDIIKHADLRPDIQVAALVKVGAEEIERILRGDRPTNAIVPALKDLSLAIDLDAVATVSKEVATRWPRTEGCPTDDAKRTFAGQLARHRQRFAFPDQFNDDVLKPLRRWVESKRKKNSDHGDFIRSSNEFRVRCENWADPKDITLLSVMKRRPACGEEQTWRDAANSMLEKGNYSRFAKPTIRIVTLEDISALEFLESDRLDWDGLSDV